MNWVRANDEYQPENTTLIVEAIMREIALARRWSTIEDCWWALLHVRKMAEDLAKENEKLNNPKPMGCGTKENG